MSGVKNILLVVMKIGELLNLLWLNEGLANYLAGRKRKADEVIDNLCEKLGTMRG